MTIEYALNFLRQHQPLSESCAYDEAVLRKLNDVRAFLLENPVEAQIPLLLNVFGPGDGHGVFLMIEENIRRFGPPQVIPHIRRGLMSDHSSVRAWNAEIGCTFPDESYRLHLEHMANSDDEVEADAARACLEFLES